MLLRTEPSFILIAPKFNIISERQLFRRGGLDVPPSISIKCNKVGLVRIAFNLLNNAIKFTNTGSVTLRGKKADANSVVLEVEDTGIGIPLEDMPKLFDRFSNVDNQRHPQGKGTGLGLSLVKELLTIMGGKISVDSELNRGTRVSIELPVIPPRFLSSELH